MNQEMYEDQEPVAQAAAPSQSPAVPIAIVIGFGLIAAAIYFSGNNNPNPTPTAVVETPTEENQIVDSGTTPNAVNPISADDHVRGNPNAPIVIVEYSDFDCPFCKRFHETMNQIIAEYGPTGKVAWVYRQLPLEQLHPSAPRIAEASECVAQLGGNDAFWTFADLVFEERGINDPTNMTKLGDYAVTAGVTETDFDACLASGAGQAGVEEDFQNAAEIGARGTPYSIVTVGDQQGVINGAQPYEVVKQVVDNLLLQLEGGSTEETAG